MPGLPRASQSGLGRQAASLRWTQRLKVQSIDTDIDVDIDIKINVVIGTDIHTDIDIDIDRDRNRDVYAVYRGKL